MRLIDADVLIKAVEDFPNCYNGWSDAYDKAFIIGAIEEAPTIEPKRGEWIVDEEQGTSTCSNCGIVWQFTDGTSGSNFCPNCGADMREREGE